MFSSVFKKYFPHIVFFFIIYSGELSSLPTFKLFTWKAFNLGLMAAAGVHVGSKNTFEEPTDETTPVTKV
jgi:hypothetical protein